MENKYKNMENIQGMLEDIRGVVQNHFQDVNQKISETMSVLNNLPLVIALRKQVEELTAELIKDLKQVHDGLAFFPTAITMPDSGMIFPEPMKDKKDWGWTVVKSIPIPEEDKEKFPDPANPGEFYKNKMDMKNMKRYDKLCFMDAAEELGMFSKK